MNKERIDLLLVDKGFFPSREKARAAIMAGSITVNGVKVDKAGTQVDKNGEIKITGATLKYVSRGGLKLEKAVENFHLDIAEKVILDIGASTGGFTDCALQNGAKKIYAVDVGYGQLDWKLRQDPRVVVLERVNARYLSPKEINEKVDLVTIDVSFISLGKIFPVLKQFLNEDGLVVALVKPQFEAGRDKVGKKGVVRDPEVHKEVIQRILALAQNSGLYCHGLTFSPVTGPEGNIEYLALFKLNINTGLMSSSEETVDEAFRHFKHPAVLSDKKFTN